MKHLAQFKNKTKTTEEDLKDELSKDKLNHTRIKIIHRVSPKLYLVIVDFGTLQTKFNLLLILQDWRIILIWVR